MSQEDFWSKQLKLEWSYPPDLESHFVLNLVIQNQPEYFILSFFEAWAPPIIAETEEERRQQVEDLSTLEAKCVARLVVTPSKMQEFVQLMTQNLVDWQNMRASLGESREIDS
jgi:hypothetical protein